MIHTLTAKYRLSARATEYFGGDVQAFGLQRESEGVYVIAQVPHWGSKRIAARVYADDARAAAVQFNSMAERADTRVA
jgi:hypothetical protein